MCRPFTPGAAPVVNAPTRLTLSFFDPERNLYLSTLDVVKPDPFRAFFDKVVLFARAMSVSPLAKDELFGEFCQLISSQRKLIPLEQFSKLRSTYESVFSQLRECAEPSEVYEALFAELMAAVD